MNKILFDGLSLQSKQSGQFHGGGEYAKFLLREAITAGYTFDVVLSRQLYTDPAIEQYLAEHPTITVHMVDGKSGVYDLIKGGQYARFFSALPSFFSDYNCSTPLFGVIHGLRSIELPWDYYRYKYARTAKDKIRDWLISQSQRMQERLKRKHIALNSRLISIKGARYIVVSEHTKHSVLSFFPHLRPEDISVHYSPFSIDAPTNAPKEDFYLMVSGNRYEKNVYRAVLAFDKLFSGGWLQGKRVKITGCKNMSLWSDVRCRDRFELLPYVSTEELNRLYECAYCFVYPSLNEGFGYPPLKAMGYGTPVVASSATSIPEVCGDAAGYFSPTNIDDMANRILRVELDRDYYASLVERGHRRVRELLDKQAADIPQLLQMIFG